MCQCIVYHSVDLIITNIIIPMHTSLCVCVCVEVVKTVVMKGKAPVDVECKHKLGKVMISPHTVLSYSSQSVHYVGCYFIHYLVDYFIASIVH